MDEHASRHLVRRYVDEIGGCTMIAPANGAQPAPGIVVRDASPILLFASRAGKRGDLEQASTTPVPHTANPDQSFVSVSGMLLMAAERDAAERRPRGLFAGNLHKEMIMTAHYDPATGTSPPQAGVGKSATEARQGVISGRVLLVLVTSTVLAVIAMIVAYAVIRG